LQATGIVHLCLMARRFKNTDRNTPLLLPPDLRDWVAQDDLVHFVIQTVERLPLTAFAINHKGCGDEPYCPHTMLALLIYCYANGVFSSRRIERANLPGCGRALPHRRHASESRHPPRVPADNLEAIAAAFVDGAGTGPGTPVAVAGHRQSGRHAYQSQRLQG